MNNTADPLDVHSMLAQIAQHDQMALPAANGSIKAMAYGNIGGGTNWATYRMERSTPFTRAGLIVPSYPQFKALYTYTPAPRNVQKAMRVTMTYTRVAYPVPAVPNSGTGGGGP